MNDQELRKHVIDELDFEPSVDAVGIGVAADNGIVTLTGHVASYAEKLAAERAVQRVKGVRGIAQEIEVRFPANKKKADDEIAAQAVHVIDWDTTIPDEAVKVKVQLGWVTLTGKVDWQYQKTAAERAVRPLSGVVGVSNLIEIKAGVQASDVKSRIESALKRSAEVEASGIRVQVSDGKVVLGGQVQSWHELDEAERAAWSVPGVTAVDDQLIVG
ncbi:BON domain-containing protein [Inquilinus sp. OTU3971]|uniref:BON domain-containing protein n=1 Tax=Inquilinus sp. OTU3971 TaxID=3043855 RepID=UPI00313D6815